MTPYRLTMHMAADPGSVAASDTSDTTGPVQVPGTATVFGETFHRWGVPLVYHKGNLTPRDPDDLTRNKLLVDHEPSRPVGYLTDYSETDTELRATHTLPDYPASLDALRELELSLRDGLSITVAPDEDTIEAIDAAIEAGWNGEPVTDPIVVSGTWIETSLVSIPQMPGARVGARLGATRLDAVRLTHRPPTGGHPMPTPTPTDTRSALADAVARGVALAEDPTFQALSARVADLEHSDTPAEAYRSMAELIRAGLGSEGRIKLDLADNTSAGSPGVMSPGVVSRVVGIIARRRHAIELFGSRPLDEGLTNAWAAYEGDFTGLVGEQVTQKSEIVSGQIPIVRKTAPIKTYAGGADNALQLIERSEPSYLESWGAIMAIAYALVTEAAFTDEVETAATGSVLLDPLTADVAEIRGKLFEASDKVDDATGAPAAFCLVAPDVWRAWGALDGLADPAYPVQNVAGTASASQLRITVSGLTVQKGRGLTAGRIMVSNSEAAGFGEDGPSFIDSLNVAKLGRDTAIYGYGCTEVDLPAGIVVNTVI